MMTILNRLRDAACWQEFYEYKKSRNQLTQKELKKLEDFIVQKKYLPVTEDLSFSYPTKHAIVKMGTSRRRIVYSYPEDETWVLKLLAYLLFRYDGKLAGNTYAFRRRMTAVSAIRDILKIPDLNERYVLKLDIHDYFNSIDTEILIGILARVIDDDEPLLSLLCTLLRQDGCYENGSLIEEKRGAMAGVPLAGFFANFYLADLDEYFLAKGIPWFRYSDDMILFLKNEKEREECFAYIMRFLDERKLTLNPDKLKYSDPGEAWEFLGFRYTSGVIDLSRGAIDKMKGRIRRKAHKLYRWRKKNHQEYDKAAKAMIRSFDHKFYDFSGDNEYTWTRYCFPIISCPDGLREIDTYMVMHLRYLYSGRYSKINYKITYEHLKQLGYTPLVAEYYNWQEENRMLDEQNRKK